jgi:hypothetical protein
MITKYVHSLFQEEFVSYAVENCNIYPDFCTFLIDLNNIITLLGLNSNEYNRWTQFYRYNIFNMNWLIVYTSWVQYRLYQSEWFQKSKQDTIEANMAFF